MITESYYVGAYWGDRRESIDDCSNRLFNCLLKLRNCDEIFRNWYRTGCSRKQALERKIPIDTLNLRKLLDKYGRHATDIGNKTIEDLGYCINIWNGESMERGEVGLSISCGLHSELSELVNCCVINLPYEGLSLERIVKSDMFVKILSSVVSSWEPDWAVATPESVRDLFKVPHRSPYYGWVLYLSERRGKVPFLPYPSRIVPIENFGNIIVINDARFDSSRKDHIKLIEKVYHILKKVGLLGPIP